MYGGFEGLDVMDSQRLDLVGIFVKVGRSSPPAVFVHNAGLCYRIFVADDCLSMVVPTTQSLEGGFGILSFRKEEWNSLHEGGRYSGLMLRQCVAADRILPRLSSPAWKGGSRVSSLKCTDRRREEELTLSCLAPGPLARSRVLHAQGGEGGGRHVEGRRVSTTVRPLRGEGWWGQGPHGFRVGGFSNFKLKPLPPWARRSGLEGVGLVNKAQLWHCRPSREVLGRTGFQARFPQGPLKRAVTGRRGGFKGRSMGQRWGLVFSGPGQVHHHSFGSGHLNRWRGGSGPGLSTTKDELEGTVDDDDFTMVSRRRSSRMMARAPPAVRGTIITEKRCVEGGGWFRSSRRRSRVDKGKSEAEGLLLSPVRESSPVVLVGGGGDGDAPVSGHSLSPSQEWSGTASMRHLMVDLDCSSLGGFDMGCDWVQGLCPSSDNVERMERRSLDLGFVVDDNVVAVDGDRCMVLGDINGYGSVEERVLLTNRHVMEGGHNQLGIVVLGIDGINMEVMEDIRPVAVDCSEFSAQMWRKENVVEVAAHMVVDFGIRKEYGEALLMEIMEDKEEEGSGKETTIVVHRPSSSCKGERELRNLVCTVNYDGMSGGGGVKEGGCSGGKRRVLFPNEATNYFLECLGF